MGEIVLLKARRFRELEHFGPVAEGGERIEPLRARGKQQSPGKSGIAHGEDFAFGDSRRKAQVLEVRNAHMLAEGSGQRQPPQGRRGKVRRRAPYILYKGVYSGANIRHTLYTPSLYHSEAEECLRIVMPPTLAFGLGRRFMVASKTVRDFLADV